MSPSSLQQRHVVAHGGRRYAEVMAFDEALGADRLGRADIVLDDGPQHRQPPFVAHRPPRSRWSQTSRGCGASLLALSPCECQVYVGPAARPPRCRADAAYPAGMDRYGRYGGDVLADAARMPRRPAPAQVAAEPGLVVEEVETGWCGAVVRVEKAGGMHVVHLQDRRGRTKGFRWGWGFLLEVGGRLCSLGSRWQPTGPDWLRRGRQRPARRAARSPSPVPPPGWLSAHGSGWRAATTPSCWRRFGGPICGSRASSSRRSTASTISSRRSGRSRPDQDGGWAFWSTISSQVEGVGDRVAASPAGSSGTRPAKCSVTPTSMSGSRSNRPASAGRPGRSSSAAGPGRRASARGSAGPTRPRPTSRWPGGAFSGRSTRSPIWSQLCSQRSRNS